MSKSSPSIFLIAVIAGIVVIGGFLFFRGSPEPADTIPPVADAGIDLMVEAGEEFILDGSNSQDDTGVQSYRWQIGAESTTGEEAEFTLNEVGVYFATLTVTDEAGNLDQATTQITVTEPDVSPEPEPQPEPTPEPEPEPEPDPTPEPALLPEIDGAVGADEYTHTKTQSTTGVKVSWANTEDTLYIALESPGSGWVAIGIDPVVAMRGANFIFGYVSGGETFVSDQFGTGMFSHSPDTGNGGTEDIIEYAGTEGTVFEFSIQLDSGDNMDKPRVPGGTYTCRLARSNSDNFTTKHSHKGSITITLD
jgi:PKD repeat protein